jgi:hypothetical protein
MGMETGPPRRLRGRQQSHPMVPDSTVSLDSTDSAEKFARAGKAPVLQHPHQRTRADTRMRRLPRSSDDSKGTETPQLELVDLWAHQWCGNTSPGPAPGRSAFRVPEGEFLSASATLPSSQLGASR